MDFRDELKNAGLTHSEITIYLFLLEYGLATPPQIAKGTKIIRANIYATLITLEKKGLIEKEINGTRSTYFAHDPVVVIQNLEKKKNAIEKILPDLRGLYKKEKNKPTVKFYYGMDEAKKVFADSANAEEILFILATDTLFEHYPHFFKQLRAEFVKKGIFARDILTKEASKTIAQKTKEAMGIYYDYRIFPKKHEDMPTSIRIHNDTVALITFDESVLCTVITNKDLAKTFKVMFEAMWMVGTK